MHAWIGLFHCSGEEPRLLDACVFVLGGRSSRLAARLCQALLRIQNPTGDPSLERDRNLAQGIALIATLWQDMRGLIAPPRRVIGIVWRAGNCSGPASYAWKEPSRVYGRAGIRSPGPGGLFLRQHGR